MCLQKNKSYLYQKLSWESAIGLVDNFLIFLSYYLLSYPDHSSLVIDY